jgi:hypothetical protein
MKLICIWDEVTAFLWHEVQYRMASFYCSEFFVLCSVNYLEFTERFCELCGIHRAVLWIIWNSQSGSVNYLEFTERFCEFSWNSQKKKEVTLHDQNTTKIKRKNCYERKRTSKWMLVCESKARPGPAKCAHRQGLLLRLWRQTRRLACLKARWWQPWAGSLPRAYLQSLGTQNMPRWQSTIKMTIK